MSLPVLSSFSRKRSSPSPTSRPAKAPRMSTLRRTESHLTLPGLENDSRSPLHTPDCSGLVPHHRTLRYYKEQREKRKTRLSRSQSVSSLTLTSPPPPPVTTPTPTRPAMPRVRASSPLAPIRTPLPPRASFPKSKPEPDLYRVAITTRMRCSPEGQKILNMGPRLALSILTATRELERIVAAQMEVDNDVGMSDGPLSNSWVVIPGEDWEMVDCHA